jgi:hypothetical protein
VIFFACTYIVQKPGHMKAMPDFIDGQLRLVRLQTDSFRLFLRQQMDKRQTSVYTMSKR